MKSNGKTTYLVFFHDLLINLYQGTILGYTIKVRRCRDSALSIHVEGDFLAVRSCLRILTCAWDTAKDDVLVLPMERSRMATHYLLLAIGDWFLAMQYSKLAMEFSFSDGIFTFSDRMLKVSDGILV